MDDDLWATAIRMQAAAAPSAAAPAEAPADEEGARVRIEDRNADAWPSDCLTVPTDRLALLNPFPQDARIKFYEEEHVYEVDRSRIRISVTGLVHAPFPHFDADAVLARMSSQKKQAKYQTTDHEAIKAGWAALGEAASRLGTKMHAAVEIYFNTGIVSADPEIGPEMEQMRRFLRNEVEPRGIRAYRTEPTIFAEPGGSVSLAGSVDFLGVDGRGDYWIMDWKRSKEIKQSAKGFYGYGEEPPFDRMENVNHVHYSLQLHTYRYLFERYYGLRIPPQNLYMVIFHVDHEDYEMYQAEDVSAQARDLFDRFDHWARKVEHHKG